MIPQVTAGGREAELALLEAEELLPVGPELANAVNRRMGAKLVTASMLVDGARIGVKTRTGERVLLCSLRAGKRRWSSTAAVIRWTRAVAQADEQGLQ